jgi:hypothetical protein
MRIFVCRFIVLSLPPGKTPFAVQLNNINNRTETTYKKITAFEFLK